MDKNGIQKPWSVIVNQAIDGMDNFVKDHLFAQMVEYGMQLSNNASALKDHTGVAMPVYQFKNV